MKRIAMTVMLRDDPEVIRQYEELHANPWPEVLKSGYECGIRRVFIYRYGRQLFMFLETVDEFDLKRDSNRILDHPKVLEWDKLTRDLQEPVPGAPSEAKWVEMKELHGVEHGRLIAP